PALPRLGVFPIPRSGRCTYMIIPPYDTSPYLTFHPRSAVPTIPWPYHHLTTLPRSTNVHSKSLAFAKLLLPLFPCARSRRVLLGLSLKYSRADIPNNARMKWFFTYYSKSLVVKKGGRRR